MTAHQIVKGQAVDPVKVRRAKELRRQMTEAERILWQYLRAFRLRGLHFRRQQVIDGFIVDFYCHAVGLIVEVDGSLHGDQAGYDEERDSVIASHNLRILRVSNAEVKQNLPSVLNRVVALCKESLD